MRNFGVASSLLPTAATVASLYCILSSSSSSSLSPAIDGNTTPRIMNHVDAYTIHPHVVSRGAARGVQRDGSTTSLSMNGHGSTCACYGCRTIFGIESENESIIGHSFMCPCLACSAGTGVENHGQAQRKQERHGSLCLCDDCRSSHQQRRQQPHGTDCLCSACALSS